MLLQVNKGTKSFGADTLFENIQFEIRGNEKIALIGRNGCGKTTLMKIIAGEEELSGGQIIKQNDIKIGYLAQTALSNEEATVYEELESVFDHLKRLQKQIEELTEKMSTDYSEKVMMQYADLQHQFEDFGGYNYQSELKTVFSRFGFSNDDLYRQIKTFSGGQRTKIAFVKLLLSKPDILLLDEPTNHLDLNTIEWLEGYLKHYPKAVVLVSHDRMFLDDICEVVYEIEFLRMQRYTGNYTQYVENKKIMMERQESAYQNQQKDIERIEALIEKFRYKKNKAAFAQSKIKYLERMERIEKPGSDNKNFHAHFEPRLKSGNKVLELLKYTVGYNEPLCSLTLEINAKQRVGIIGPNGKGKSTLVKSIVGNIPALSGELLMGHQVEIGYFDQQMAQIDSTKTVLEELWDEYPELDKTAVRTALGNFLFSGDDVFKEVNVLSGGEKVRLCFAKLMLKRANFLILDEPTNHLDIMGKEALEDALMAYQGTILFVSHDRYFIRKLATQIVEIDDGKATYYPLTYNEYLDKKNGIETVIKKNEPVEKVKPQRNFNYGKEIKKTEEAIQKAEEKLEELRALRFEPEYYQDGRKMNELDLQIDDVHVQIDQLMEKWEALTLEAEEKGKI